jgi:glutamyl-tRNA synthetase
MIKVRFAPSPTGSLHIGGARTALFNYLFARHNGGQFLLRIEDTDRSRYVPGSTQEIFDNLRWLGIEWGNATVFQSERLPIYTKYAEQLLKEGKAYRCYCPIDSTDPCHCRGLIDSPQDKPHVIRLKLNKEVVNFMDKIRGLISYDLSDRSDPVLIKSDGFPTYHMANVVDDHLMEITHVLRGEEWIPSTPLHLMLYKAFGWDPPAFVHLPVITDMKGKKLSKRDGGVSVTEFKEAGFLPNALVNYLALLGWAPGDDREKMSMQELIDAFSLERINAKSAKFDVKKMEWLNGQYLAEEPTIALLPFIVQKWRERGWIPQELADKPFDDPYFVSVVDLFKVRSKRINEIVDNAEYFFRDPSTYATTFTAGSLATLDTLATKLETLDEFTIPVLKHVYNTYSSVTEIPLGNLIHPTRWALTGIKTGPGLFELMAVLGKSTTIRRLRRVVNQGGAVC